MIGVGSLILTAYLASGAAPAPTLSAVSTAGGAVGDIAGAYTATLTGTNFTGATGVTFGGTAATSVVVVNATTITCTVPAHATGAVSVVVTTPGGSNGANTLFRYFSPAERAANGWWRASYVPSSMPGVASAGLSGGRSIAQDAALDAVATTGTAVNGYVPAVFDSVTGRALATAIAGSNFFTTTSGTIVLLMKRGTNTAPAANVFGDAAIVGDGSIYTLGLSSSGVGFGVYDGAQKVTSRMAIDTANYHLIAARWDGTNINLRVDSTDAAAVLAATLGALTNPAIFGKQPAIAFADASMLECVFLPVTESGATLLDYKSYFNTRYALSL